MKTLFRLFFCSLFSCGIHAYAQDLRPNIVVIIADDVGYNDLGCYGNKAAKTPNIDALAANGIKFTNAFLTASSCSPSRCSIISGRYPHNTGAPELHMPLPMHVPTIAGQLKKSGYYVASSGKWHLGDAAKNDFNLVTDSKFGDGGEARWLETMRTIPENKPFFMWLAAIDAHRTWGENEYSGTTNPDDISVPPYLVNNSATRKDLAQYTDEIVRFDVYVGKVVEELKRQNKFDNTMIIVMADNGRPFPRCKTRLYDDGIKTPFIVHWNSHLKQKGTSSDVLLSVIDLAPTFAAIAGEVPLLSYQGVSFLDVLNNPEKEIRKYVFAEHNWHDYEAYERMVRTRNYLIIKNLRSWLPQSTSADNHREVAFQELVKVKNSGMLLPAQVDNFVSPRSIEEFYDCKADSLQLTNLISDEKYFNKVNELRKILSQWQEETGDTQPVRLTQSRYDYFTAEDISGIERGDFFKNHRGEIPGEAKRASWINAPGPR
jgi:arylsulfatase A-like enzyme